jgi:hypothetical protein
MSDRIVRPTFGRTHGHNASNVETAIMVALALGTAWLMLLGARDVGAWIMSWPVFR